MNIQVNGYAIDTLKQALQESSMLWQERIDQAERGERQNLSMTFESKPPAPVDNERNRSKFFGVTAALVYAAGAAFDRSRIRARIIERHH